MIKTIISNEFSKIIKVTFKLVKTLIKKVNL